MLQPPSLFNFTLLSFYILFFQLFEVYLLQGYAHHGQQIVVIFIPNQPLTILDKVE